jgi:glycosyltransferase involved in cell wall biosynthesis
VSTRVDVSLRHSLLRLVHGGAVGAQVLASLATAGGRGGPRVFYGGARAGDRGGPQVKAARLRQHFAEHRWAYNLLYTLSGAPPLPGWALALLRRRGIAHVHNQDGVYYAAWYDGDWRAANARMARTYHAADHVFWQSEFCRRCADRFLGERRGAGEILYNAVDTARFAPAPAPRRDGPFVFLATGGFAPHLYYRVASTLEGFATAVARGLDARLRLAGWMTPAVAARTRAQAEALGLAGRVELAGPYRQTEAPEVYRQADAYVTTVYQDVCPNAVLEALACGLPVVYGASGGTPELVGEAGIGVPVEDDWTQVHVPDGRALGEAMFEVVSRRDSLAGLARQRAAERFDIGPWIARHRAVFEALTA